MASALGNARLFGMAAFRNATTSAYLGYETLKVTTPEPFVVGVEISRPKLRNAMNVQMRNELTDCFEKLSADEDCRSVVLTGDGTCFTSGFANASKKPLNTLILPNNRSGLDLNEAVAMFTADSATDVARRAFMFHKHLLPFQHTFTVMEKCLKPVIAAVHGACIGAGVDMVTSCDVRYCTDDAVFQIKEVDIGLAADVGTLQRLPKCIGSQSLVRELAYTCRPLGGVEAFRCGLVSRIFADRCDMIQAAFRLAATIAEKSPVAVQGTKRNLNFSRDHSVSDGLEFVGVWNQAMLQSEDIFKAMQGTLEKKKPIFSKL